MIALNRMIWMAEVQIGSVATCEMYATLALLVSIAYADSV